MKKIILAAAPLAVSYILSSCGNTDQQNVSTNSPGTSNTIVNNSDTAVGSKAGESTEENLTEYNYEPSVSTVTGILTSETFYGPPGFGETPQQDEKEKILILKLDKPITIITTEGSDEFNVTRDDVTEVQLSGSGIELASFENKKVKVTGMFYGAHTGHHYTDVLMAVQKAEKL